MISTKQDEVNSAITTIGRQLVILEDKLEELKLSSDNDDVTSLSQDKAEVLQQFEEVLKGVKASQKLLNELLNELVSKSQEEAVPKSARNQTGSITVSFGARNSGFQVGNINGGVSGLTFGGR